MPEQPQASSSVMMQLSTELRPTPPWSCGDAGAGQPELPGTLDDLPRKLAALVELRRGGCDLRLGESARRLLERQLVVAEVEIHWDSESFLFLERALGRSETRRRSGAGQPDGSSAQRRGGGFRAGGSRGPGTGDRRWRRPAARSASAGSPPAVGTRGRRSKGRPPGARKRRRPARRHSTIQVRTPRRPWRGPGSPPCGATPAAFEESVTVEGVRASSLPRGDHLSVVGLLDALRGKAQEHLAESGAVRRKPAADPQARPHQAVRHLAVQMDHLELPQHTQVGGLPGLLGELLQQGARLAHQAAVAREGAPDLETADARGDSDRCGGTARRSRPVRGWRGAGTRCSCGGRAGWTARSRRAPLRRRTPPAGPARC